MKNGVILINCARGGIVNEKDLREAIQEGRVAGAALDVFEKEPAVGNPLVELDEVICTPHLGASTGEAQENVAVAIVQQVIDFLVLGEVRNAVNIPSVSPDVLPLLRPFIQLGEKPGYGEGARYWVEGKAAPQGECGINTSGGLIAKGHPIGATRVAMIGWCAWQLQGKVPKELQVPDARAAATFNIGGPICPSVCTVLSPAT